MLVTGLKCFRCKAVHAFHPRAYLCPNCESQPGEPGILDVEYDYAAARSRFAECAAEHGGVFRYLPLLPLDQPGAVLPAGDTPLVPAPRLARALGLGAVWLKDETRNPTRCLKDRATAVGVTLAMQNGFRDVYCASAGNAAISLAGFAANAGLGCHVFVPRDASETRLNWLRRFGADLRVSSGNYDQAYREAEEAGRANGWYSRNCAFNPFLVEGKKTAALEIAQQLRGEPADFVLSPAGDGCTPGAIGKGFREAVQMGWIARAPKLVGVQARPVTPLVDRFEERPPGDYSGDTQAASIRVRQPRNALRLLSELQASGGFMIAVNDEEIAKAQTLLGEEAGVIAEFTSAATLAALLRMAPRHAGARVVLVITGGRLDEPAYPRTSTAA
jgi:threonine synthase